MSYSERKSMNFLIGKVILSAQINDNNDIVVLKTSNDTIYLAWNGDCCAQCYLAHFSGLENLIGHEIVSIEDTEWMNLENGTYGDVLEAMGTTIKTNKGVVTFETRVSHNGYYGGWIAVSTTNPLDQYGSFKGADGLRDLKDF